MAQVTVTIGGRVYRLACNEGEQPHLESLAGDIDARINEIRGSFGEIGDQRLIVMAALTVADELSEARRTIARLEKDAAEGAEADTIARRDSDKQAAALAQTLGDAAHRVERLAAALGQPAKG